MNGYDELDDDHIEYIRSAKYFAKYLSLEKEAEGQVVRVSTLFDEQEFFAWTNHTPTNLHRTYFGLRKTTLAGFRHYTIPSLVLERSLPLSAVAKIFETLNRTGVRLDTFDLMVAKLYPSGFRLRDAANLSCALAHSTIGAFEIDGIEILKAVALRAHMTQVSQGLAPSIKGVRESDVIKFYY